MTAPHFLMGLKPIRKMRCLKASELADLIGLAPTSYSRLERGERRMYFDQAVTIARRLCVRVDDLIGPLTEDATTQLLDERDKATIAAGGTIKHLWTPLSGRYGIVGASPESLDELGLEATVPPPPQAPSLDVPPPPPADDTEEAEAALAGWTDDE